MKPIQSLLLSAVLLSSALAIESHAANFSKEIEVQTIVSGALAPEAITVSDDGEAIAFLARSSREFPTAPPTTAWITRRKNGKWTQAKALPISGMVTSVAFGNNDKWLVASTSIGTVQGYANILKLFFSDKEKIGDLPNFDHRVLILDAQNPKRVLQSFNSRDLGLARSEMLKHARVSPDGKWLAYYTHGFEEQRGVYIYNFETRETVHLGLHDDKHPIWTPDGQKILFHSQVGGNSFTQTGEPEKSLIGYYDLQISGNSIRPTRVLMDENAEGYIYQKHPSVYPGTDMLVFHASSGPEKSKKIYVRKLAPGSKMYKLSDLVDEADIEISSAKHANSSSFAASGLFFVGKKKGAVTSEVRDMSHNPDYSLPTTVYDLKDIYWMPDAEVRKIYKKIK